MHIVPKLQEINCYKPLLFSIFIHLVELRGTQSKRELQNKSFMPMVVYVTYKFRSRANESLFIIESSFICLEVLLYRILI